MERIDKINYYLDIAETVTERGTCLRRNFGAIIVKNDEIISTGYCGAPRGRKNCIDLGPILFVFASLKHGATFINTNRLKIKESDRGMAMHEELKKLGGGLIIGDNAITVPKQMLQFNGTVLSGHNDHRIVMALSVILSQIGGSICGVSAVRKSYPGFFEDIESLGAEVELQ